MQEIEVTGTIDQQGYIQLDHPLTISDRKNVRIIILIPETDEDNDEPDKSVLAGLHQALSEVKAGQTLPLSELNKTAASEPPNLFGFLPKRADPLTFQQEMRDEWSR
jgi:hypothetical protein